MALSYSMLTESYLQQPRHAPLPCELLFRVTESAFRNVLAHEPNGPPRLLDVRWRQLFDRENVTFGARFQRHRPDGPGYIAGQEFVFQWVIAGHRLRDQCRGWDRIPQTDYEALYEEVVQRDSVRRELQRVRDRVVEMTMMPPQIFSRVDVEQAMRIVSLDGLPDITFYDDVVLTETKTDKGAEKKAIALLRDWLSPAQLSQFNDTGMFEVKGSAGGSYRIRPERSYNIDRLDAQTGGVIETYCFLPQRAPALGDIMLAQKITLETDEPGALKVANRLPGCSWRAATLGTPYNGNAWVSAEL